ncbi:MAG: anthranilate phosphoribosyltransferase [Chthonomonadaceae bacterium]|uniref:Anthranilate phosphoribosyltransferase n=1 Tax=Candidatus Nitrosymbiomonas proteolyticus TaxID=2608984 RepID=A0A809S2H2_9BACT|nr:anthranilate phosphoribosyltransferase [Candidatus Nitrosymbiomonas proteolyticus]
MEFGPTLTALLSGDALTFDEAAEQMRRIADSELSEAQVGALLTALRSRPCAAEELAGFASVLRQRSLSLDLATPGLVDTCGTGGGIPSFNISTAAAMIACAAGVPLAKHGNRSVTSSCGSADVLEALGVGLIAEPEELTHVFEQTGMAFLFAPHLHPTMKLVGPIRKQLGIRTVFNQLGPLVNPASARFQVLGVYDPQFLRPMAEALGILNAQEAWVVHGQDGLDEVSPRARTSYARVVEGRVVEGELLPQDFGIEPVPESALAPGETLAQSAAILREAISDADSDRFRAVLPSAALAISLGKQIGGLLDASELAEETVRSGRASAKLDHLIEVTRQP